MTRRDAGFTLIEVLVALVALGMVLAMLGQGVWVGLRGTASYHQVVHAQADMEPVERALRHMIERMDPGVYPEPPAIRGSAAALAFTTELPNPAQGGTLTADVRLEAAGGRLLLCWTPHTRGVPFAGQAAAACQVMLDDVARLELSYAPRRGGAAWRPDWAEPALPGLVRLRLLRADGQAAWPTIIASAPREQAEE